MKKDAISIKYFLRSMDLMDLAFSGGVQTWNGQHMPSYTPKLSLAGMGGSCNTSAASIAVRISLPYFNVEEEGSGVADASEEKKRRHHNNRSRGCLKTMLPRRPKLVHIDEANSKAAEKLLGPNKAPRAVRKS